MDTIEQSLVFGNKVINLKRQCRGKVNFAVRQDGLPSVVSQGTIVISTFKGMVDTDTLWDDCLPILTKLVGGKKRRSVVMPNMTGSEINGFMRVVEQVGGM